MSNPMIKVVKPLSVVILGSLSASLALAQSSTVSASGAAVNQSVAEAQPTEKKEFKMPVRFNIFTQFWGPSVTKLNKNYNPAGSLGNQDDEESHSTHDPLYSINTLSVIRDLGNDYYVSANLEFKSVYTNPTNAQGPGSDTFQWRDSFIRLNKAGLVTLPVGDGGFSLDTNLRYYLPTSRAYWRSNSYGSVRFNLNPNYQFGKSPFSITTSNYVKAWMNSRGDNIDTGSALKQLEFYTGPQLNAVINDRVSVSLLFEAVMFRNTAGTWSNQPELANATTDLEPMVDITLMKGVTLTPFLNWYTALPISTTSINMQLNAAL